MVSITHLSKSTHTIRDYDALSGEVCNDFGQINRSDNSLEVQVGHNHEADKQKLKFAKLKNTLKQRAEHSTTDLREIFDSVCADVEDSVATNLSFPQIESSMYIREGEECTRHYREARA